MGGSLKLFSPYRYGNAAEQVKLLLWPWSP